MMKPVLEELKKEYNGKLEVVFIDVWENRKAAEDYKIQSIPTQIFYDANGKELSRHVWFISKKDILAQFKEHNINITK
jgi:thioredoxin 1